MEYWCPSRSTLYSGHHEGGRVLIIYVTIGDGCLAAQISRYRGRECLVLSLHLVNLSFCIVAALQISRPYLLGLVWICTSWVWSVYSPRQQAASNGIGLEVSYPRQPICSALFMCVAHDCILHCIPKEATTVFVSFVVWVGLDLLDLRTFAACVADM